MFALQIKNTAKGMSAFHGTIDLYFDKGDNYILFLNIFNKRK